MTSSTTDQSAAQPVAAKNRRDGGPERDDKPNGTPAGSSPAQLEDLARADRELTQEVRQLVARRLVEQGSNGDEPEGVDLMLTTARSELLEQLLADQQEQARHQLADAVRSSEDAVTGVVRSMTAIVHSIVPAALVRPADLIEATYLLADQGLRVGRRVALTVTGGARDLVPSR